MNSSPSSSSASSPLQDLSPGDPNWRHPPEGMRRRADTHFLVHMRSTRFPLRVDRDSMHVSPGWVIFGNRVPSLPSSLGGPRRTVDQIAHPSELILRVEEVTSRRLEPKPDRDMTTRAEALARHQGVPAPLPDGD